MRISAAPPPSPSVRQRRVVPVRPVDGPSRPGSPARESRSPVPPPRVAPAAGVHAPSRAIRSYLSVADLERRQSLDALLGLDLRV